MPSSGTVGRLPLDAKLARRRPVIERIMAKVRHVGECWVWTGAWNRHSGRPRIAVDTDAHVDARRWLWQAAERQLGPDEVLRRCTAEERCVRPSHQRVMLRGELPKPTRRVVLGDNE